MIRLPLEIIKLILTHLAADSTFNLAPSTQVSRLWRSCASPLLLETVVVYSLGDVVKFCNHVIRARSISLFSYFEHYTTTIILSGHVYDGPMLDPDLVWMQYSGPGEALAEPDTTLSETQIQSKLNISVSRFQKLNSLEWYGRFAGDELVVAQLRREGKIRNVVLGSDSYLEEDGLEYSPQAFSFTNLISLTIMTKNEHDSRLAVKFINIAHCSPQLEHLAFQGDAGGLTMIDTWSLQDLIGDRGNPSRPVRVWPGLKHLELRYFSGKFWKSAQDIEELIQFLLLHDRLECVVFKPLYWTGHALPFSLAAYSSALPNLRRLHGPLRFITGVCGSSSARASLRYIFDTPDNFTEECDFFDEFISTFSQAQSTSLKKLRISTSKTSPALFSQLAQLAPNLEFLELLPPLNSYGRSDKRLGLPTGEMDPLNYIPEALAQFPQLRIIGHEPTAEFILPLRASNKPNRNNPAQWILQLAKAVPQLESIQVEQTHILKILRDAEGAPSLQIGDITCLDRLEYSGWALEVDWIYRTLSKEQKRERYLECVNDVDDVCKLLCDP
ncbi:hypothetical protein BDV93DRAFT_610676 [Ceratobasidium sp. AG-I]|nr:hypothetical protein BDV93DRAFT_610676 [Ceratobasidium sp. AG-I]